jgi:hypothetical protein
MDSNEPTAWEEINPPMALAPLQGRQGPCSVSTSLEPASSEQFAVELTACLALVVPVGMTEEARREWLSVAWTTLKHLPSDLLARGCHAARQTCDHPSKIVPAILDATRESIEARKRIGRSDYAALPAPCRKSVMDRRGEPMSDEDTETLNRILESLGATARYRSDGSRYSIETGG